MSEQTMQRTSSVEETGMTTTSEFSTELAPTAMAAEKQFEIQSAIVLARRFPRNEEQAFEKLMKACKRTSFAESAEYSYPRGQSTVSGPSVNVAREAARVWGNIRYGIDVTRDDPDSRSIRGWAWDLETNTKVQAEDDFRKVVFRKGYNGAPGREIPTDERELRELTNRRGAILVRNCILQILPKDLIEDALYQSSKTLKTKAEQDPEGEKKRVIMAFSELNVAPAMLETYLAHPLAQCSPAEIVKLRGVYKSISDGHTTWADYANGGEPKEPTKPEDLKSKLSSERGVQPTTVDAEPDDEPPTLRQIVEGRLSKYSDKQRAAFLKKYDLKDLADADESDLVAMEAALAS